MADTKTDDKIDSTKQPVGATFAGADETPKDDKTVDTRNDDPSINPAPNPGPDAPTGDAAVEAFPDQDEVLQSKPSGGKPKKHTEERTGSDQDGGNVIEVEVVDAPTLPLFTAYKSVANVFRIKRAGWIGPEALEVTDSELKEFKAFVASL